MSRRNPVEDLGPRRLVRSHSDGPNPYQYLVVRVVPRAEREEFINMGVILHIPAAELLLCEIDLDAQRLTTLWPTINEPAVVASLEAIRAICRGEQVTGLPHLRDAKERFGWLSAARSAVVRTSPVHSGLTSDPQACLEELVSSYVRLPPGPRDPG